MTRQLLVIPHVSAHCRIPAYNLTFNLDRMITQQSHDPTQAKSPPYTRGGGLIPTFTDTRAHQVRSWITLEEPNLI